jgi:hypothetical protein
MSEDTAVLVRLALDPEELGRALLAGTAGAGPDDPEPDPDGDDGGDGPPDFIFIVPV